MSTSESVTDELGLVQGPLSPAAAPGFGRGLGGWLALLVGALLLGLAIATALGKGVLAGAWLAADPRLALLAGTLALACKFTLAYLLLAFAFNRLRVHQRFGIFRSVETESHFLTTLRNWKVPFLWTFGLAATCYLLQIQDVRGGSHPSLSLRIPDEYVFLKSPSLFTDVLYAVVGFYLIDLADWAAHRLNHYGPFYTRFPFAHFVHHNMVFINPFTVFSSPLVHFAQITGLCMYALMLSQNLLLPVFLIHSVKTFSNFASHLGCDPLPWLSRLNHRVGGWIPWIPVHHQYHHVPGLRGNYGNITALWDYVFGTLSPESRHHLETGKPLPAVAAVMANSGGEIDRFMAGKTRFNIGSSS